MESFANELGCLAQGIRDVLGTDTIDFIPHSYVPFGTTAPYGRIVCTYRLHKTKKHCTCLTAGGNLFICLYDVNGVSAQHITDALC